MYLPNQLNKGSNFWGFFASQFSISGLRVLVSVVSNLNWRQCHKAMQLSFTSILLWKISPFADISKLENIIKNFAAKQEPLPMSFSSIGSLPNENNVLFLAPTPTLSLLQFHSQLCDAMKKEGIEVGDEHRPDTWIPLCPVAEEVPKIRMPEAFTVLRDLKLPISGYAMDVGLVEYPPVRELFSFMLGNTAE
ncbi:unnamed protein product [Fraxinus pennsylvanica]|uniref:Uncharacterized protein n=1 Tax=Fraxinus pennsylvanica TaxID=56036 RepID=A0AAD1Z6F5_9LAMI|nr:unnamed protein product [Fraxinus pennsylvanica]